jgi:flagellar hook assembly protein FlgD
LPEKTQTRITVYDILGREIIILSDKILVAGTYTIRWDGRDKVGLKVPTGIYFYRFDTFAFSDVRKMIYLK